MKTFSNLRTELFYEQVENILLEEEHSDFEKLELILSLYEQDIIDLSTEELCTIYEFKELVLETQQSLVPAASRELKAPGKSLVPAASRELKAPGKSLIRTIDNTTNRGERFMGNITPKAKQALTVATKTGAGRAIGTGAARAIGARVVGAAVSGPVGAGMLATQAGYEAGKALNKIPAVERGTNRVGKAIAGFIDRIRGNGEVNRAISRDEWKKRGASDDKLGKHADMQITRNLQKDLNRGGANLKVDGIMGPKTQAAIDSQTKVSQSAKTTKSPAKIVPSSSKKKSIPSNIDWSEIRSKMGEVSSASKQAASSASRASSAFSKMGTGVPAKREQPRLSSSEMKKNPGSGKWM